MLTTDRILQNSNSKDTHKKHSHVQTNIFKSLSLFTKCGRYWGAGKFVSKEQQYIQRAYIEAQKDMCCVLLWL